MMKSFGAMLITACISAGSSGCATQDQTLEQRTRMEQVALDRTRAATVAHHDAEVALSAATRAPAAPAQRGKAYSINDCVTICTQDDEWSYECYDGDGNYEHLQYQLDPNTGLMYSDPSFCDLCEGTACDDPKTY